MLGNAVWLSSYLLCIPIPVCPKLLRVFLNFSAWNLKISKLPVQQMASRSTICDFKEKLQSEKKNFNDVEAKI